MPFQPGQSGNPHGRGKGSITRLSHEAQAIFAKFELDPLEEQLKLVKTLQGAVMRHQEPLMKLEYRKLLLQTLRELVKYKYPQLKAIEHSGDVDMTHRLQQFDALPDSALAEAIRDLREERRALNGSHS